jgi:dTDP-4-dehydrorhamnose 3,5-epimerase
MKFRSTELSDVIKINPRIFSDSRGEFLETYRQEEFFQQGIDVNFVQDNHAGSHQGVLRGLHYQIEQTQGKLVRVVAGQIYDVAVDLRKGSMTFGQYIGITLDDRDKCMLWIPPGFAHGYYVLSDWAEVSYKVTDYYAPEWERTIRWNDPELGIKWPLLDDSHPILSESDRQAIPLSEAEVYE